MTVSYGDLNAGWFVTALGVFSSPRDDANDEYIALKQLKEAWDLEVLAAAAKTEADEASAEAVALMAAATEASTQANAQLAAARVELEEAQSAVQANIKEAELIELLAAAAESIDTLKANLTTFMATKHTHDSTEPADIASRRLASEAVNSAGDTAHQLAVKVRVRAQIAVDAAQDASNRADTTRIERSTEHRNSNVLVAAAVILKTDCEAIVAKALVAYNAVRSA